MTHNSDAVKQADISVDAGLTGWRHGAVWTYLVMLAASAAAFVRLPHAVGGDAAARPQSRRQARLRRECRGLLLAVAESWQAEFINSPD